MTNPYLKGFKKGDKLKCVTARDLHDLQVGKVYIALTDEQEGIFEDRPFITVKEKVGTKSLTAHSSRFELVTG